MNSVVSFDFAERFVIKNRHFSCSSIWYPIIIYCSSRRMESEWILLRVDNLSLVLHVVVNIRSDLFTMSFSPFPLLHRSSVLSIATSPALSFVPFPSHPSQLQPGEAMVLAATQIMPLSNSVSNWMYLLSIISHYLTLRLTSTQQQPLLRSGWHVLPPLPLPLPPWTGYHLELPRWMYGLQQYFQAVVVSQHANMPLPVPTSMTTLSLNTSELPTMAAW